MRHREGAQHDGIDQAENRRIGADAQAEGEHGDEQESGASPEGAAGVAKVLPESVHSGSYSIPSAYAPETKAPSSRANTPVRRPRIGQGSPGAMSRTAPTARR